MPLVKLQRRKLPKNENGYQVNLPKIWVEENLKWYPGLHLEIELIEKGKTETINKPFLRISKADNLWVDKTKED